MKIKELLRENEDNYLFSSKPLTKRVESSTVKTNIDDINYTPGKAALDKEYEETEQHTHTHIPNKQKKLDDPRK
jgi:hypothetical protein